MLVPAVHRENVDVAVSKTRQFPVAGAVDNAPLYGDGALTDVLLLVFQRLANALQMPNAQNLRLRC